jgi:hypothetical protein
MKRKKYFFAIIFILSFCATVKSQTLYIYSDIPDAQIIINDTVCTSHSYQYYEKEDIDPTEIEIPHKTKLLNIQIAQNDSIIKDSTLNWKHGMRNLFIDTLGNVKFYRNLSKIFSKKYAELNFRQYKKGSFNALFAIPEVNFYDLKPEGETRKFNGGFLGAGLGLEGFYKKNKSLQLRGEYILSFIIPVPAAFDPDRYSSWETTGAWNVSFTDNFIFQRFQLGYGLNFALNNWNLSGYHIKRTEDEITAGKQEEWVEGRGSKSYMLGFAFNAYYRITNHFYIGIIYRPSFLELTTPKFIYEHTLSVDFMFNVGR